MQKYLSFLLAVALLLSPVLDSVAYAKTVSTYSSYDKTSYVEEKTKTETKKEVLDPAIQAHQLLVRFHPKALNVAKMDKYAEYTLEKFLDSYGFDLIDQMTAHNVVVVSHPSLESNSAFLDMIARVESEDMVDYAEVNRYFELTADPESPDQWHLADMNISEDNPVAGNDMAVTAASSLQPTAQGIVVAVLDSGMDYTHPDLRRAAWVPPAVYPPEVDLAEAQPEYICYSSDVDANGDPVPLEEGCWNHGYTFEIEVEQAAPGAAFSYNAIRHDDPMDTDPNQHGTHLAGIIAAEKNNNQFGAGIASGAALMAVKVTSEHIGELVDVVPGNLEGLNRARGVVSSLVEGVDFAKHNGAHVINLSVTVDFRADSNLGQNGFRTLAMAIDSFVDNGGVVVTAAGQSGIARLDRLAIPCNFTSTICVTATDINDELMNEANVGAANAQLPFYGGVDIAAPGVNVLSTANGEMALMSGTSVAAAQVSGAVALVLAHQSNFVALAATNTPKEVLMNSGDMLPSLVESTNSGVRVNLHKALCSITGDFYYQQYCLGLQDTDMREGPYHCEGVWQAIGPGVRNCFKLGVGNNRSVLLNVSSSIPPAPSSTVSTSPDVVIIPSPEPEDDVASSTPPGNVSSTPDGVVSSTPPGNVSSTPDVEPSFADAVGMLYQSMLPLKDGVAYDLNFSYQSSEHGEFAVYLLHKITGEKTELTYMPVGNEDMLDGMTLPVSEQRRLHRYRFETPVGVRALYDLVFVANGEDYYRTVYRNGEDLDEAVVSFQLHRASITEVEEDFLEQ